MNGRFASHDPRTKDKENEEDEDWVEESELASQDTVDEDDGVGVEDVDGEMVLSKDDFDLLQAFHRLVPLPALRSKILRVVCDDDLQVAEEERHNEDVGKLTIAAGRLASNETKPPQSVVSVSSATSTGMLTTVKHSPLTRRLSTKPVKLHREINLTAQTPRLKKLSTYTIAKCGDDRVG